MNIIYVLLLLSIVASKVIQLTEGKESCQKINKDEDSKFGYTLEILNSTKADRIHVTIWGANGYGTKTDTGDVYHGPGWFITDTMSGSMSSDLISNIPIIDKDVTELCMVPSRDMEVEYNVYLNIFNGASQIGLLFGLILLLI